MPGYAGKVIQDAKRDAKQFSLCLPQSLEQNLHRLFQSASASR